MSDGLTSDEHPLHTLQRVAGNRVTTLLVQRQRPSPVAHDDQTSLPADATQDQLHAAYLRGRELSDAGRFEEAIAVWTAVYAHPMMRGNTARRAGLALAIGRANQRAGHSTEAISWFQEVISTPGARPEDVATARTFLTQERRGGETEQGVTPDAALPPDASDDLLYQRYLEGHALLHAGLYDRAIATWVAVYEHPNLTVDKRDNLAAVIGEAHFHAHRFDQAISWLVEAMQTEGADPHTVSVAERRIAECRRGSEAAGGVSVGPPLPRDATDADLYAQYLEGRALFDAGLFERAIATWVPVHEHPNMVTERRAPLAATIGTAHHHLHNYRAAVGWYNEALARGLGDTEAVQTHRRLAFARARQPFVEGRTGRRPTIRRGWTGSHVRHLQERLVAFGYELQVDGRFGGETDRRVREFQQSNGLVSDGVVGPKTWYVLS